jgi:hypothetical protein
VPPALAFLLVLGILYSDSGGAPLPEYAVSAGVLTVIASWLTVALVDAEDPVQRLVLLAHARRVSALLRGMVAAVLLCCVGLTLISLLWSSAIHRGNGFGVLAIGLAAHVACATLGVAIGLACSRLVLPRLGYTVLTTPVLLIVVLLVRGIPLINPMLRAMTAGTPATGAVLVGLVTSAVVLALSAVAVGTLFQRRS